MEKKEKLVDLKTKVEKISDEHLKDIQEKVNVVNNLQYNIGKVEAQKHNLLHELALAQNKIIEMQDVLQKEYGTNDINIADGTINWKEDEK
jgi:hypothetical protein|tara:strand:+ start:278 stop:550 length:273 start_codon:yes stop_codon:yes gene_type:complete